MFRKCLITDLQLSDRLSTSGLKRIVFDLVKYSFSGEPFLPPACARTLMDELISPEHSICRIKIRGSYVTHV
jgi:hypothetical protein